ncbi:MAG TPA: ATP-binding protein [Bacteroidales bacterium]|nr:ATP-binding protein [Bacteroidales bacterium]
MIPVCFLAVNAQDYSRLDQDSLRRILNFRILPDSTRIHTLWNLAKSFEYSNQDSLLHYAMALKGVSEKSGDQKGLARYYLLSGYYFEDMGREHDARQCLEKAEEIAIQTEDPTLLCSVYIDLGNIFLSQEMTERAIDYQYKALSLSRKLKSTNFELKALGNLMISYEDAGDHVKSAEIGRELLKTYDSGHLNSPSIKSGTLHNLAVALSGLGRNGEALKYYLQACQINKQINNRFFLKQNLEQIGNLFSEDTQDSLARMTGDHRSSREIAFSYFRELESILNEDRDTAELIILYANMGEGYISANKPQQALGILLKGWRWIGKTEDPEMRGIYTDHLANTYFALHDFKKAAEFYQSRIILRDSLEKVEIAGKVAKLGARNEISLRDEKLKEQEQKIRDERSILYLFIALASLILVVAAILFYYFKQKQRSARELEKKNREIEEARARAERSEKFKEQFLANMSHEIRTPLNAVIGITDLLLDDPQPPKTESYLKNVKEAGEHLLVILNDILDLSKVEAGKLELVEAPFHLPEFIRGIRELFQARVREKDLLLITRLDEHSPLWLCGDSTRLKQVLVNLIGNAIKFTDKGSVSLIINPEEAGEDHCTLRFSVEDTGPGIPPDQLSSIFEEFVQSAGIGEKIYKGTGLGLSISRKLVERMGGKLDVESQPGAGSAFFFSLPFRRSSESAYLQSRSPSLEAIEPRNGSYRILVVEDNPSNIVVTEGHLQKILPQSSVRVVRDGTAAIDLLEKQPIDLILMDVQMPGLNGYETTRRIRSMKGPNARVPVIAFTASVIRTDIQLCLAAGMNAYVPKPVNRKILADTLFQQLGFREAPSKLTPDREGIDFLALIPHLPQWAPALADQCNGRKERFLKYLEIFIRESEQELGAWQEHINLHRSERLAQSIHRMMSYIKIFSDENSYANAQVLEEKLRRKWHRDAVSSITDLKSNLEKSRQESLDMMNVLDRGA